MTEYITIRISLDALAYAVYIIGAIVVVVNIWALFFSNKDDA